MASERTPAWPTPLAAPRGKRFRAVAELLAERAVFGIALASSLAVLLIFAFVGREALPVLSGRATTARPEVIRPEEMDSVSRERLREYLGLSAAEFAAKDRSALQLLLEVKAEAAAEAGTGPDSHVNSVALPMLVKPYQWAGYDSARYVWQPGGGVPKYNIVPLLAGSLKVTLIAMLVAVPLALGAALYVSQLSGRHFALWAKPAIEMLAGVPGVVLGAFALIAFAPVFQRVTGAPFQLNAVVAGIALGIAVVPLVFSLAEDALSGVPADLTTAALALGATRWEAAWNVVFPAAAPGIGAAVLLGFGRALGETMIVLIASGNAATLGWSPLEPVRTITATIAAELGETPFGGHHYRMLFLLGTLLFVMTFAINFAARRVLSGLRRRLEGTT
jgi:phosphate transport system permease protein